MNLDSHLSDPHFFDQQKIIDNSKKEDKVKESQKEKSSNITLGDKQHDITVNSKELNLTDNQTSKMHELDEEIGQEKDSNDKQTDIKSSSLIVDTTGDKSLIVKDKILKPLPQIPRKKDESLKESQESKITSIKPKPLPELPQEPKKIQTDEVTHLFLIESHSYIGLFLDELINTAKDPDVKKELIQLKQDTLEKLVGDKGIYKSDWLKGVKQTDVEKEWSSEEEATRQKEANKLLNNAMYEGLYILENSGDLGGAKNVGELHFKLCNKMANIKKENVLVDDKIDIHFKYDIKNENDQPIVNVRMHTSQFGDKITGSMDKRRAVDGKFYGVNIHTEKASFKSPNGQIVSSTLLRSGSFDFDGIEVKKEDYQFTPLSEEERKDQEIMLIGLSAEGLKKHINDIRKGHDPEKFSHLIQVLKACKDNPALQQIDPKGWNHAIEKYEEEFKNMVKDELIIKGNASCIKDVFKSVQENKDKGNQLGLNLPNDVTKLFENDPDLKSENQNWGMFSLQTPVNVASGKGINEAILRLAQNPLMPKIIGKYLKMLAGSDTSELNPIYRELRGYKSACSDTKEVKNGLYFNIPTNFIGAEKTIIRLGPFSITLPIKSILNNGLVDKSRYNEVMEETQKSTQKVYELANRARTLVENRIKTDPPISENEKKTLTRYLTSLDCLIEQTFTTTTSLDGTVKVTLKPATGEDAQYETVGRLTVLMEMIGFNTTGHCRSGNNRTAAWLAKSHQVVGAMTSSENGEIPPPQEMAGSLANSIGSGTMMGGIVDKMMQKFHLTKKPEDHWSLEIFLNSFKTSLTLQQANKGTQGTKLSVKEAGNKTMRTALMQGAFQLAGKFEETSLDRVKLNKIKENKFSEAEINQFIEKIRIDSSEHRDPVVRGSGIARLKKLQKVLNESGNENAGRLGVKILGVIDELEETNKYNSILNAIKNDKLSTAEISKYIDKLESDSREHNLPEVRSATQQRLFIIQSALVKSNPEKSQALGKKIQETLSKIQNTLSEDQEVLNLKKNK